mmetsp:Transcript_986/g.3057  ORF Transcript_986/g.3057 Transcript_986/m.3057 type:complete len:235 (-) Transcript_986:6-710(-)
MDGQITDKDAHRAEESVQGHGNHAFADERLFRRGVRKQLASALSPLLAKKPWLSAEGLVPAQLHLFLVVAQRTHVTATSALVELVKRLLEWALGGERGNHATVQGEETEIVPIPVTEPDRDFHALLHVLETLKRHRKHRHLLGQSALSSHVGGAEHHIHAGQRDHVLSVVRPAAQPRGSLSFSMCDYLVQGEEQRLLCRGTASIDLSRCVVRNQNLQLCAGSPHHVTGEQLLEL